MRPSSISPDTWSSIGFCLKKVWERDYYHFPLDGDALGTSSAYGPQNAFWTYSTMRAHLPLSKIRWINMAPQLLTVKKTQNSVKNASEIIYHTDIFTFTHSDFHVSTWKHKYPILVHKCICLVILPFGLAPPSPLSPHVAQVYPVNHTSLNKGAFTVIFKLGFACLEIFIQYQI